MVLHRLACYLLLAAWISGCAIGGKLYAIGGRIGNTSTDPAFTSTVEQYDPKADLWSIVSETPTKRKHATASVVDGKCYVIGGQSSARSSAGPAVSTVEVFDTEKNRWSRRADMPTPRFTAASAVVDGKIYITGGYTNNTRPSNVLEVYDPATDTWESKTSMPTARGSLGAAAVNGKVYAIGGGQHYRLPQYDIVEQYDPISDRWTTKSPMPSGKGFVSVVADNDRIYAIGGFSDFWVFDNQVFMYDPAKNTWNPRLELPSRRGVFLALPLGGKIYVSGGIPGRTSPAQSSTDEYTP